METILFDLDDTLIESMHVWEDAVIHLFKKMDLDMSMEEARQIFFTMKFSEVLTYIKERFHTKQDEAWMFNEVHEDILNQYAYHIEAKKGALDYIKKCASEKKKMVVLTGSLTLTHSQNSQMSFMYGFFFVKFLIFAVVCVVIMI